MNKLCPELPHGVPVVLGISWDVRTSRDGPKSQAICVPGCLGNLWDIPLKWTPAKWSVWQSTQFSHLY